MVLLKKNNISTHAERWTQINREELSSTQILLFTELHSKQRIAILAHCNAVKQFGAFILLHSKSDYSQIFCGVSIAVPASNSEMSKPHRSFKDLFEDLWKIDPQGFWTCL